MVWADEHPIAKPRVRKARPGEVPGWIVSVDYDSGTREETWQSWHIAVHRALVAAGPVEIEGAPAGEWIEREDGARVARWDPRPIPRLAFLDEPAPRRWP